MSDPDHLTLRCRVARHDVCTSRRCGCHCHAVNPPLPFDIEDRP